MLFALIQRSPLAVDSIMKSLGSPIREYYLPPKVQLRDTRPNCPCELNLLSKLGSAKGKIGRGRVVDKWKPKIGSRGRLRRMGVAVECIGGTGVPTLQSSFGYEQPLLREGPSCIFVGPVETAEKDRLEALYQQARDSYYSGRPLIIDDMFDKVEVRLRWYGSKLVLKYPRCSLKRLSVYSDAEVDQSQVWALASVWMMLLAVGFAAAAGPPACALNRVCKDAVGLRLSPHNYAFSSEAVMMANGLIATVIGLSIGVPMATAAVGALQGLWRGDLVALKGPCPNCGEEVYAFVRADKSVQPRQKTECHVCEHSLVFHAKVEHRASPSGRPWAYGRVYLVTSSKDFSPP